MEAMQKVMSVWKSDTATMGKIMFSVFKEIIQRVFADMPGHA